MTQNGRTKLIARMLVFTLALVITWACAAVHPFADTNTDQETSPGGVTTQAPDEVGAFEVTKYDFKAKVRKDHSYYVVEKISVNIPDDLTVIEFSIPSGNFRIQNLQVEDTAYTAKTASEASKVSIVDPEKLTRGSHEYTIKYLLREYQDKDPSKDMFYFNVLLPEWKQPIGRVSIKVAFPEDFPWDDMQCYSGKATLIETLPIGCFHSGSSTLK